MKNLHRFTIGLSAVILTAGLFTLTPQAASIPRLSNTTLTMTSKTSASLKLSKVSTSKKIRNTIRWSTSNKNIVSLSGAATKTLSTKITAKNKGTAYIYARLKYNGKTNKTLRCKVKVIAAPKLNKSSLTLTAGKSYTSLSISNLPTSKSIRSTIRWSTSSSKKVKFSGTTKGKVKPKITAVKPGSAVITAKVKADGARWTTMTCKITVKAAKVPATIFYPGISIADARAQRENNVFYKLVSDTVLEETNNYRKRNGLSPLKYSEKLSDLANYRALEVAKSKTLSHVRYDKSTFKDLGQKGFHYSLSCMDVENIASGYTTYDQVLDGNATAKSNMLRSNTHVGIGYARDEKTKIGYVVQIFGKES